MYVLIWMYALHCITMIFPGFTLIGHHFPSFSYQKLSDHRPYLSSKSMDPSPLASTSLNRSWLLVGVPMGARHWKTHDSMDWFKGNFTGKPHISWENLWFPVGFPLNQSIEWHLKQENVGDFNPWNPYFLKQLLLMDFHPPQTVFQVYWSIVTSHFRGIYL